MQNDETHETDSGRALLPTLTGLLQRPPANINALP
jgi:hypothetical protein